MLPVDLAALLVKSTVLLVAAWLVTRVMLPRRASAAARHLVWTLAVCGLVLLPLLGAVVPRWEAAWLPAAPSAAPYAAATGGPTAADPFSPARGIPSPDGYGSSEVPAAPEVAAPAESAPTPAPAHPQSAARVLAVAYVLGLLGVAGWAAAGFLTVRRIVSRAETVTDPAWTGLLRDVLWELDVDRPVRLLRSAASPAPMAVGLWRASVVIPAAADGWPHARRRAVLLHEAAHVARRDTLTQAAAVAACALYWFHPGAWYAARRLRTERELACDDRVLGAGTTPHAYAGDLLEIARAFHAPRLATPAAVSMARPSQLEGRMLAVLDTLRSRRSVARPAAAGAVAATLALVLPLAALRPARGADADAPVVPLAADDVPPLPSPPPAEALVRAASGGRLELRLGAAAEVRVSGWDRAAVQVRSWAQDGAPGADVALDAVEGGARIVSTPRGRRPGPHTLEVRVPLRYDLRIAGGGSQVEVRGVTGRMAGSTQGGGLVLDGVSGEAALATAGGTASVSGSRLRGGVWTAGGDAEVRGNEGDLRVRADGGTAVVELGDGEGRSSLRRFAGSVRTIAGLDGVAVDQPDGAVLVHDARGGADVRTGRGDVEIGTAEGHARVRTGRGNVALRHAIGSVDVATAAGDVFVRMHNTRGAAVRSERGSVTLVLPADFRGVIEATVGGRRPGRIRSDFPLRALPAHDPALRRAAATVPGAEGARVTVSATDGDVTIRRAPPAPR